MGIPLKSVKKLIQWWRDHAKGTTPSKVADGPWGPMEGVLLHHWTPPVVVTWEPPAHSPPLVAATPGEMDSYCGAALADQGIPWGQAPCVLSHAGRSWAALGCPGQSQVSPGVSRGVPGLPGLSRGVPGCPGVSRNVPGVQACVPPTMGEHQTWC